MQQFIMFAMFHSARASLFVANTRWILITLFAIVQRQREENAAGRRAQNQLLYADCRTARNVNSLYLALSPVYVRARSPCVCMRAWSLDFLVKPATEWASTNGGGSMALEVWIIHEDISLHSPLRRVPFLAHPAPRCLSCSHVYIHRDHHSSDQEPLLVCPIFSRPPVTSRSQNDNYISNLKNRF